MNVIWLSPTLCDPPHRVSHPEKVDDLTEAFERAGWDPEEPALVGYVNGGRVQLLSGSHRWVSAVQAIIDIPVVVHPIREVYAAFGDLKAWARLMAAPKAGTRRDHGEDRDRSVAQDLA